MIRWMITILIRLAPDTIDTNLPKGMIDEDKQTGLGAAILIESTSEAIIDRATKLFNWLRSLSDLLSTCCKDLVVQLQHGNDVVNQDENDLLKMEVCCQPLRQFLT